MNILFLTLGRLNNIEDHAMYPDLLRKFRDCGHTIYSVSPYERRIGRNTECRNENGLHALRVKVGNITKCGMIEKGISTILIEYQFKKAIKRYFANVKFDLVLYSTPPITFVKVIEYIKKRDGARTYLMLKDIFPQNAVDLGMMSKSGVKGLIYKYFRRKEEHLYSVSDRIGCMSQANVDYVLKHNPEVNISKVEVCPNCIEVQDVSLSDDAKQEMRMKYDIPTDKIVFVYGGNLGKPQGIPHIIKCLKTQKNNSDIFFLIVGDGTEYGKLETYFNTYKPTNIKLMKRLQKEDYDRMIAACDVGLIFLEHRFKIPNFPSRLLAYMQARLPVLACTDSNTDIGKVIVNGGFGWWCESNDVEAFGNQVQKVVEADLSNMGKIGFEYLNEHYTVAKTYEIINWEDIR